MRKIEKIVYNFDELDKGVQDKLIEKRKETEIDDYCNYYLESDMEEVAINLLQEKFVNYKSFDNLNLIPSFMRIYCDLSYSQGSGSCFEFDVNIRVLLDKYNVFKNSEITRLIIDKELINNNTVHILHNSYCRYYHEYSCTSDYYFDSNLSYDDIKDDYNISQEEFNSIEKILNELLDFDINNLSPFWKDCIDMFKKLTKNGYDMIENCVDMDVLLDNLRLDEYFIDGSVYDE